MSKLIRSSHLAAALALTLNGTLLSSTAYASCASGDIKCRMAEQKNKQQQQQQDQAAAEQKSQQTQTGGAGHWDPDAEQGEEQSQRGQDERDE